MTILNTLFTIFLVILVFNLMIVVHEWGHFLAARWRGLKIEKFYVWFGKPLWKKTINGVEYGLGSLPFGGFVALPQMVPMGGIEGEVKQDGLPAVSALDKAIVAFAGPLFSFLLACAFAVAVWLCGKPQSEMHSTTIVGDVAEESPAAKAGIRAGDRILSVDGHPVKRFEGLVDSVRWSMVASEGETIAFEFEREGEGVKRVEVDPKAWPDLPATEQAEKSSWVSAIFKRPELRDVGLLGQMTPMVGQIMPNSPAAEAGLMPSDLLLKADGQPLRSMRSLGRYIEDKPGKPVMLEVERDGKPLTLTLTPRIPDKNNMKEVGDKKEFAMIGVVWDLEGKRTTIKPGPSPVEQVSDAVRHMGALVSKLLSPKSDLSPAHMSGPVGVGRLYYKLFQHPEGWRLVLWFSVVFNINLAIMNMLPFPVLDGGHITMAILEAIRRKPPQGRVLEYIQTACALLLFGFLIFVTLKDAGDFFGGGKKAPGEPKTLEIEWLPKDKRSVQASS
jgi:regulator of sigma E protease